MTLVLRYMRLSDVRPVVAIDRLCFHPSWSQDSYAFEINESRVSHMVVLEQLESGHQPQPARPDGWLSRLGGRLRGDSQVADRTGAIVGYGGLWKIEGEAHVSTIATHPDWRGHGFGEILLAGMFGKALRLNAEFIVLEVRVSNAVAQALYRKYGFSRFGRKKNYYRNDKEDAWDMRVALDKEARPRFEQLYDKLRLQHGFQDNYSFVSHPRR